MSRFLLALEPHREALGLERMPALLRELRERMDAEAAEVDLRFPVFRRKAAPVSGESGWMDYEGRLVGRVDAEGLVVRAGAVVAVASLCPCSKAISDYGAHMQRGHVHLDVTPRRGESGAFAPLPFDDLVAVAERHASAPLYPVLKRPDERHVTMQAYDTPAFVEDMARGIAADLREDPRVEAFTVRVVNQESIHQHDAFAETSWSRSGR